MIAKPHPVSGIAFFRMKFDILLIPKLHESGLVQSHLGIKEMAAQKSEYGFILYLQVCTYCGCAKAQIRWKENPKNSSSIGSNI